MTMAKISKLPWSNGQNWSILIIDHGQNRGCHGHGQKFLTMTMAKISKLPWSNGQNWSILTIDHGQNRGCHGHGQFF